MAAEPRPRAHPRRRDRLHAARAHADRARLRAASPRLLGAAREAGDRGERHQQDLEIQPEREVLDVVVVPLGSIGDRGLTAQTVHLRPPRDAGLDAVALVVAIYAALELRHELGALGTWPAEAHLRLDDVDELRQLVDRRPP